MADYELHAPSTQHPRMPKHQVCHDGPTVGFVLRKTTNPPIHTRLLYTPCIVASLKACAQLASVLQFIQHQYALWQSHKTRLKGVSMPPRPPMGARGHASAHYNCNQHTTVVAMRTLIAVHMLVKKGKGPAIWADARTVNKTKVRRVQQHSTPYNCPTKDCNCPSAYQELYGGGNCACGPSTSTRFCTPCSVTLGIDKEQPASNSYPRA